LTKSLGSSNKVNNAYATALALAQLKPAPELKNNGKPEKTAEPVAA
jgi:ribosomal protein S5